MEQRNHFAEENRRDDRSGEQGNNTHIDMVKMGIEDCPITFGCFEELPINHQVCKVRVGVNNPRE